MTFDGEGIGSADERTQLLGFLDFLRDAVVRKTDGLSEEQVRWKPAPTANALLNLIVHLTGVERFWVQQVVAGHDVERDRDAELAELPPDVELSSVVADYRRETQRNNETLRGVSLDGPCRGKGIDLNVRWVVIHLIEETGRHAGHADITRELIDGAVGE